jgi:hypothetical protein
LPCIALVEQGVEPELKSFCVLGVAAKGSTALIHYAAYLFTTLTIWLWSLTSRDREALYTGLREPLMQYVGYGLPRKLLLGAWVNNLLTENNSSQIHLKFIALAMMGPARVRRTTGCISGGDVSH